MIFLFFQFLPARKVKEKAIKLKKSLTKDMLQGAMSKNILAMTFRQVVLQHIWSFELALFRPGTERNMDNLENPGEVRSMRNSLCLLVVALYPSVCLL